MPQNRAWVKDSFKVQDRSKYLKITEYKKIHVVSDSTSQVSLKKLPFLPKKYAHDYL